MIFVTAETDRAEEGFVRVFGAGQTVFRKGDPAAGMYLVLQGRVEVAGGPGGPVVLTAGDVFGEEGVAGGFRRFTTARAAGETLLLVITEESFLRLVRLKPELVLQAVKKMAERVARWGGAERDPAKEKAGSGAGVGAGSGVKAEEGEDKKSRGSARPSARAGAGGGGREEESAAAAEFLALAAGPAAAEPRQNVPPEPVPAGGDQAGARITFDKKVTCPVCRSPFVTKSFFAHKLKLVRQDPELRNHYANFEPLLFGVWVCPNCYYAGLADSFDQLSPRQRAVLLEGSSGRREKFGDLGEGERRRALKAHLLLLENLSQIDADPVQVAKVWLRLAWLNDDAGNGEAAAAARKKALEMLEKVYFTSTRALTPEQDQQMAYLIGELHARLGNPEEALRYMRQAAMQKKGNAQFARQVQDRIYELKNAGKDKGGKEA